MRRWSVVLILALTACQSTTTHLFTYASQGVVIEAERLVGPFFGKVVDPLPYGGADIDLPLQRMRERFSRLKPQLDAGALCLAEKGELAFRDRDVTTRELRALVRSENRDRAVLYRAMSRSVGYPDPAFLPYVEATFAAEWQKQAPAGWCLRTERG